MGCHNACFATAAAVILLSACCAPTEVSQATAAVQERTVKVERHSDQDMMYAIDRWNAVANRMPVELPPPFGRVTFHWDGWRFPHPTGKGGSTQAYGAFGDVLATFLGDPETFEFLAKGNLFTANLRSGVPGGPGGPDYGWTFIELAAKFQAGPLAAQSEAARASLRSSYDRMRAVETARYKVPR